jgi:NADH dehydrogenase FAD-containing subunit
MIHVVVIGGNRSSLTKGSAGGAKTIRELKSKIPRENLKITLIERQQEVFYTVASPRAIVNQEFASTMFVSLAKLFKHHPESKVIQGVVTSVNAKSVILENGEVIDYDFLVVATGASYPGPFKLHAVTKEQGLKELNEYREKIKAANNIFLIGGGSVGVETAAEIKEAFPEKVVTIIQSGDSLLTNTISKSTKDALLKKVKALGIEVVFNERIDLDKYPDLSKPLEMVSNKGTVFKSDYAFNCIGRLTPNSAFLKRLDVLDERGFVNVKPTLQVSNGSFANIFALGDVANTGSSKNYYYCDDQSKVVVNNIDAIVKGNGKVFNYSPPDDNLGFVSLGTKDGFGFVPYFPQMFSNFFAYYLKSKDFFTSIALGSYK